jgi:hypothetical protein
VLITVTVSPLLAYLASEKCPLTGQLHAAHDGAISLLACWRDGVTIETDGLWLIDGIAARLAH